VAFFVAVKYIISSERNDLYEITTTQLVKMSRGWNRANSIPSRSLRDRLVIYIIYLDRLWLKLSLIRCRIPLPGTELICRVKPGVYFYKIQSGTYSVTGKMIYMK